MSTHLGGNEFVSDVKICKVSMRADWLHDFEREGELKSRLAKLRHQLETSIFPIPQGMNDDEVRAAIAGEIAELEQQITPPK